MIKVTHPDSSTISEVLYEPETGFMRVTFARTNSQYHFSDVPPEVHLGFIGAVSPGHYYNTYIRGFFPWDGQMPEILQDAH